MRTTRYLSLERFSVLQSLPDGQQRQMPFFLFNILCNVVKLVAPRAGILSIDENVANKELGRNFACDEFQQGGLAGARTTQHLSITVHENNQMRGERGFPYQG
jgi:hypothetical protein